MFFNQLEYKQNWLGGLVIKVDPKHTSQTCPCCNFKHKDNRQTQSEFVCIECGYSENADYVASLNIRTRGQMELANC